MRLLETEIHINARPETVWSILTDFDSYPEWNPFITHIHGNAAVGETLEVNVSPPGGKAMAFKPVVLAATENEEFRWLGRFLVSALFEGEHSFILTPHEGGCRLIQKEQFKGILVPLMWRSLDQGTRAGFELMNQALKERAERAEL
nr:SRPBCC domain-containing protein [uncultured Desulfuromonas sp.]